MALAVTVTQVDFTGKNYLVHGTIVPSGSYATHGDTLDLVSALVPTNQVPLSVRISEQPSQGTSQSGYVYGFCPGTTAANGAMTVFLGGAATGDPLAELAAGAYPSAVTGATIVFDAIIPRI